MLLKISKHVKMCYNNTDVFYIKMFIYLYCFLFTQRLVVCLEESLYIHNIRDMKVLHTIRDTPPNPLGLCVLSACNDNNFLAYPGSSSIGEVQIFDAFNLVFFFFNFLIICYMNFIT